MQLCRNKKGRGLFIKRALLRGPHLPREEVVADCSLPERRPKHGMMEGLREMPQSQKASPGGVMDLAPAFCVWLARR